MDLPTRRAPIILLALTLVVFAAAVIVGASMFWPHGPREGGQGETSTAVAGMTTTPVSVQSGPPSTIPPATTSTTGRPTSTTQMAPVLPQPFAADRAMVHIRALAQDIGVRRGGSDAEATAVAYVDGCLRDLGYAVEVTEVPLPDGRISRNLACVLPGLSDSTLILGAHVDSLPPSPGGNDNASGVAVLLELARDLAGARPVPTIEFVFFGNEEVVDGDPDHHHYGSRRFVQDLKPEQAAVLAGMVSVDMIAYGSKLVVRTMGRGPRELADMLIAHMTARGSAAAYERDPGPTGWSDHEAFEDAGYPVAWVERISDSAHHTRSDTYEHCDAGLVQQTGEALLGFVTDLTADDVTALLSARRLAAQAQ